MWLKCGSPSELPPARGYCPRFSGMGRRSPV